MDFLFNNFDAVSWKNIVMYAVGIVLIYLAIKKEYEPALLLPMGFGAILVNLPLSGVVNQIMPGIGETSGVIEWLFNTGIHASEAMPLLLFVGIGAMIDFSPLLTKPVYFLFGAGAHFGIFASIALATLLGFDMKDAASIGIIGAADGPTTILVSQVLRSNYLGAIAVTAYSYMALVPIIQPFAIRLVTTKKERLIRMEPIASSEAPKLLKIVFPILTTVIVGFIAPAAAALIGFLMFGNLVRECGVLKSLSDTAQKELTNIITLLLGITIAFTMQADGFITVDTIKIMAIGLFAFIFDTIGGVFFAKFINIFLKKKVNPMIGAAGISAFPMSARVIQKMALKEDPQNIFLMHAVSANVSGQIASVIASGLVLSLITKFI
ncbi:sodium ion-translocating decarboxylase subunit beta [Leadbettera azotonutricia]|uniref:Oxaloacetate decarboxylase beta chain n=1 Tax=Leadbettera azotonutricia (strain ATCC BAA-888 / DSM 13862 / ZAS-9) TaxID=545695 RepID=F5YBF9_LEAAZ|nr:sodium ion-translocating decarboxylase subunit beta [Leadbettera azotonutricia]AEF80680.1 oxaloacetate decarboxylase beta chain [Leadbettera azotonutricia ZAS-9]